MRYEVWLIMDSCYFGPYNFKKKNQLGVSLTVEEEDSVCLGHR